VVWIKIAAVYFVVGIALGTYMGASGDHSLFPVHAHINLLGWVSPVLFGLIIRQFPQMADTWLARIQFWLFNLALPVQMMALAFLLRGNAAIEPVVGIASAVIGISVVLFAVNVFLNVK